MRSINWKLFVWLKETHSVNVVINCNFQVPHFSNFFKKRNSELFFLSFFTKHHAYCFDYWFHDIFWAPIWRQQTFYTFSPWSKTGHDLMSSIFDVIINFIVLLLPLWWSFIICRSEIHLWVFSFMVQQPFFDFVFLGMGIISDGSICCKEK